MKKSNLSNVFNVVFVNILLISLSACGFSSSDEIKRDTKGKQQIIKTASSTKKTSSVLKSKPVIAVNSKKNPKVKNDTKVKKEEPEYDEGFSYSMVDVPFPTDSGAGKVEVIEFFWYGCPHCFTLEPVVHSWNRPKNVDFKLMPAVSKNGWALTGAKTFYTAVALGVLDKIHTKLFTAIHQDRKHDLISDVKKIASFFEKNAGISKDKFYSAWNSFGVDSNIKKAISIFEKSGLDGVPALIVNGKYRTSPTDAGSRYKVMGVVDFLIAKESK